MARRVRGSNPRWCHPDVGLASRPIPALATLQRADEGIRTLDSRLDRAGALMTRLSYASMRTRNRIRTCTVRALNALPPTSLGHPGMLWTDPESNRAREACKATLHTSAQPKASGRARTASCRLRGGCTTCRAALAWSRRRGSNPLPPVYKTGAPTCGASPQGASPARRFTGTVPSAGFEPALARLSTRCLSLLGYEDRRSQPRIRTSVS
jgi:hypothetical protein